MSDLFWSIGATVAGLAGAGYYVWAAVHAHNALAWPTVPARIEQSEITIVPGRWRAYKPSVTYTYQVGSKSYTSKRVFFGQAFFSTAAKGFAEKRQTEYQVGKSVQVHVHPDNPAL